MARGALLMAASPLCRGAVAEVCKASDGLGCRLDSRVGDVVELQGLEEAGGWVYASREEGSGCSQEGYLLANTLAPHTVAQVAADAGAGRNAARRWATVHTATERSDGYLATRVGDPVQVLHLEYDEGGGTWAYVRRLQEGCRDSPAAATSVVSGVATAEGWVDAATLRAPLRQPRPEEPATPLASGEGGAVLRPGGRVVATACVEAERSSGYLSVETGSTLQILHVGGAADEAGWIFARAASGLAGWLMVSNVRILVEKGAPPSQSDAVTSPVVDVHASAKVLAGAACMEEVHLRPRQAGIVLPTPMPPSRRCPVLEALPPMVQATSSRAKECVPTCAASEPIVVATPMGCKEAQEWTSHRRLRLLTFGLENCESSLVNRCVDSPLGGAGETFRDEELLVALRRVGQPRVDMVLDARCFPDPRAQHVTNHTGVHPEIISRIVENANFPRYLWDVRRKWRTALVAREEEEASGAPGSSGPELVIAVYCRSGKHRSVAVAECLRHIGDAAEGLEVADVMHLSKKRWGKNVCRGGCTECAPFSQVRQSSLEQAACIWRQAS